MVGGCFDTSDLPIVLLSVGDCCSADNAFRIDYTYSCELRE